MTPPLVTASWLADHMHDTRVRVIDFRWYLSGARGSDAYAAGHVPGSVFVDLADVTAAEGPGRHPLPTPERLQDAMRRAGVEPDSHVIVVDDANGSIAARLWWLLRAHGHDSVSVLDGGLPIWTHDGHALTTDAPAARRGAFVASARTALVVDKTVVRDRPADVLLLDVRAAERYRGDVEPVDARAGHVPGAVNVPWTGNLRADGTFADAVTLRARYEALGAAERPVVVSCGSGVTACHTLLAFELAGLPAPRLYEGSFSDWASDPDLEVATGAPVATESRSIST